MAAASPSNAPDGGESASDALTLTILDPFPTDEPDAVETSEDTQGAGDTHEDDAGPEPDPEQDATAADATATEDTGETSSPADSGGCQSTAPTPAPLAFVLVALVAMMTRRRWLV